jgi:hypothetical protein
MFDPGVLRVNLREFFLRRMKDNALRANDKGSGTGGSLINGKNYV